MRTRSIVGLVVIVSMFFTSSLALAAWKGYRGSGGWGMGTSYQRMYNPASVETLTGTVEAVDKVMPMKGMYYGIHLLLKTDKETVSVHLGPGWYIERLDMKIEKGDKIQVKGSKVTMMGKPAIIASEVRKGDSVLMLRDENGIPLWSGWKR